MILKGLVVDEIYKEILLLHIPYRLISTPNHCDDDINTASELLQTFVENFGKLFGENSITCYVLSLLHLPQSVREMDTTTTLSAYGYEHFLYEMKRKIRKPNLILQQIKNKFRDTPLKIKEKFKNLEKMRL